MNKRSFIKNMLNFLFLGHRKHIAANIAPAKARKIQKNYLINKCETETPYSQPYVEIAKQIFSSKAEVSRAAIFYLQQIALNEDTSAEPILAILQSYNESPKCNKENAVYLQNAIQEIKFKYKK